MVIEGARVPRCLADVGIKDGKNAEIGRFKDNDARKVIDAKGLVVGPGFVALHTRNDAPFHREPYLGISSWHGVTSLTIGNCGFAPLRQQDAERVMLALSRTEAVPPETMWGSIRTDWKTFPQYLERFSQMPLGVNVSHLFPISYASVCDGRL